MPSIDDSRRRGPYRFLLRYTATGIARYSPISFLFSSSGLDNLRKNNKTKHFFYFIFSKEKQKCKENNYVCICRKRKGEEKKSIQPVTAVESQQQQHLRHNVLALSLSELRQLLSSSLFFKQRYSCVYCSFFIIFLLSFSLILNPLIHFIF